MNLTRHPSRNGVALVVTLLLLTVITFLAVAFLALSRRERQSVTLSITQSEARLLADAAAARAQAEIFAQVFVKTNLLGAPLMVSRSYQDTNGFVPGISGYGNVNWDYRAGGGALNVADRLQLLTNLFFDPRLPVFVQTNSDPTFPRDFRFYVDFNRNGRFDTNGRSQTFNAAGLPVGQDFLTGDPEWIGVLAQPKYGHSPTNRALGRYAYVVVPVGLTLDLNHIHNDAKANLGLPPALPATDGFLRNQGVGSYELNLAGFLRELNTNYYLPLSYNYSTSTAPAVANTGRAFQDASAILGRRLAGNANNQMSIANLFGGAATAPFLRSGIDFLSIGRPMVFGDETRPWPGSPSVNIFDDVQELFDTNKTSFQFARDLRDMGTNTSTYDRYSFYRLLSQLGVGTAPTVQGKVNLNYTNDIARNAVSDNFSDRTNIAFFLAAADKILTNSFLPGQTTLVQSNGYEFNARIPFGFSITNIPVYPTNFYNAAVHRVLQVAANLSEATSSNRYPAVFRPVFVREGDTLRIGGFVNEVGTNFLSYRIFDYQTLSTNNNVTQQGVNFNVLAFGQPMVIGARKYLPNLNEIGLLSLVNAQRKLELRKGQPQDLFPNETNQLFVVGITNQMAVEAWYPYTNNYQPSANQLQIVGVLQPNVSLYNPLRQPGSQVIFNVAGQPMNQPANYIRFSTNLGPGWAATRFVVPMATNTFTLPNTVYSAIANRFSAIAPNAISNQFERVGLDPVEFQLAVNTRLQFAIIDRTANRILDYVSLDGLGFTVNLLEAFREYSRNREYWDTNALAGVTRQIRDAADPPATISARQTLGIPDQPPKEIDRLRVFINLPPNNYARSDFPLTPQLKVYFDASDTIGIVSSYSADDPLVHYTVKDLTKPRDDDPNTRGVLRGAVSFEIPSVTGLGVTNAANLSIGRINDLGRYAPWGDPRMPGSRTSLQQAQAAGPLPTDLRFRDPLIRQPDDWDFPTNKLASLGQIGRVHRGTPWQTIYLKAFPDHAEGTATWIGRTGLGRMPESHPTNDWKLPDYFTTLPSESSALGLLSVNQSDRAAWAAGLAGVVTLTNDIASIDQFTAPRFSPLVIGPGSNSFRLIVDGINRARSKLTSSAQMFTGIGQILEAPELTVQSPFLNLAGNQTAFGITDEAYERIPRQILSLLRVGEPRYLVYAYGQSLRPADNSIVFNAPYQNLVTNYQITGEMVTRSLIRLEGPHTNPVVVVEKFDVLPSE